MPLLPLPAMSAVHAAERNAVLRLAEASPVASPARESTQRAQGQICVDLGDVRELERQEVHRDLVAVRVLTHPLRDAPRAARGVFRRSPQHHRTPTPLTPSGCNHNIPNLRALMLQLRITSRAPLRMYCPHTPTHRWPGVPAEPPRRTSCKCPHLRRVCGAARGALGRRSAAGG